MDAIAANLAWLKDLHSAQGEVTLREALAELKAWCETADFKLMEHVSSVSGRKTALIKEWKEIFGDVGDSQSLLASLKDSPYFKAFADQASVCRRTSRCSTSASRASTPFSAGAGRGSSVWANGNCAEACVA